MPYSQQRRYVERRPTVRRGSDDQPPRYAIGLDLGYTRDYTALVLLERIPPQAGSTNQPSDVSHSSIFRVLEAKRFALRTEMPDVIERVAWLMNRPMLRDKAALVVDG